MELLESTILSVPGIPGPTNISLKFVDLARLYLIRGGLSIDHPTGRKLTVLKRASGRRGESPITGYPPLAPLCKKPVSIWIQAGTTYDLSCH